MKFDELPQSNRALLLATLDLEIAEANCANILDLSRKRKQSIPDVWHDICRKAGQPRCAPPGQVLVARDQWLESVAAGYLTTKTAPLSSQSPRAIQEDEQTALPVRGASARAAAAFGVRRSRFGQAPLVAGGIVVIALAAGALTWMASSSSAPAPQASLRMSDTGSGDLIRDGITIHTRSDGSVYSGSADRPLGRAPMPDKPQIDPSAIPPPMGTIRRMDAISKAFLRK